MLALMHLLAWCQDRRGWAHLSFSIMVLGVLGLAACELVVMRTDSLRTAGDADCTAPLHLCNLPNQRTDPAGCTADQHRLARDGLSDIKKGEIGCRANTAEDGAEAAAAPKPEAGARPGEY